MQQNEHKFPFAWYLRDGYPAKGITYHGKKVFGTFICGGGSSMGYKLAGYEHLGGVELDPTVADVYKTNHHPKYLYNMDIRDFNAKTDLPSDLFDLDLLDGSPPCSTFSSAGSREAAWGKEKQFSEGQKFQSLDDLVFVYCDTIKKLMPKVCLLENVSGLAKGNAKVYLKNIVKRITDIGYAPQIFLLNAATMGVPQHRERIFIIGLRKDFNLPKLQMKFNENPIIFAEVIDRDDQRRSLSQYLMNLWEKRTKKDFSFGDIIERLEKRCSMFSNPIFHSGRVAFTITSSAGVNCLYDIPRNLNRRELCKIGTYPLDYNFKGKQPQWYIGMSVPPVMTAQIAHQIYLQWLSKM